MGLMLLFLQIWMLYINVVEHVIQQSDHFMSKGRERGVRVSSPLWARVSSCLWASH